MDFSARRNYDPRIIISGVPKNRNSMSFPRKGTGAVGATIGILHFVQGDIDPLSSKLGTPNIHNSS